MGSWHWVEPALKITAGLHVTGTLAGRPDLAVKVGDALPPDTWAGLRADVAGGLSANVPDSRRCPIWTSPNRTNRARCRDGRAVNLITIEGMDHEWPGSQSARKEADSPSKALDATATIWEFFATHPKP